MKRLIALLCLITVNLAAAQDTRPPLLTNLTWSVTSNTATFTWSTDEPSDTSLDWGGSSNYLEHGTSYSAKTTSHVLTISSWLSPSNRYFFRASSRDAAGNEGVQKGSFVTAGILRADTSPPALTIATPRNLEVVEQRLIEVSGVAADASGIEEVTVNGIRAIGTNKWVAQIELPEGTNTITVTAMEGGTNHFRLQTTRKIQVIHQHPISTVPLEPVLGEQRTLVVLGDFRDGRQPVATLEQVNAAMGSLSDLILEQSYGLAWLSGQTLDWVSIEPPASGLPMACVFNQNHPVFQDVIRTNRINLADYKRVIILVDGYGGCGAGRITLPNGVPGPTVCAATIKSDFFQPGFSLYAAWMLVHELGHSLGLKHANGWDCKQGSLIGDCQPAEYGNPFDPMGTGRYGLHFNARYKQLLGWVPTNRIVEIRRTGFYTIKALEQTTGPVLARIYDRNGWLSTYYIEARRGVGFNVGLRTNQLAGVVDGKYVAAGTPVEPGVRSNEDGIFINVANDPSVNSPTYLLDMEPLAGVNWSEDSKQVTLNIGAGSFSDTNRGITIGPVAGVTDTSVTFYVTVEGSAQEQTKPPPPSNADLAIQKLRAIVAEIEALLKPASITN